MATLIPSMVTCVYRMTSGERRLAERLEQKLDKDYLLKLPSLREETFAIADQLNSAHQKGHAWGDMAIVCANWKGPQDDSSTMCTAFFCPLPGTTRR